MTALRIYNHKVAAPTVYFGPFQSGCLKEISKKNLHKWWSSSAITLAWMRGEKVMFIIFTAKASQLAILKAMSNLVNCTQLNAPPYPFFTGMYLHSHSLAFSVLHSRYGPPLFHIRVLKLIRWQTLIPVVYSLFFFLFHHLPFSAFIQTHTAICKNMEGALQID